VRARLQTRVVRGVLGNVHAGSPGFRGEMNRLETGGGAGAAGVGSAKTLARVRIDADCFD